MLKSTAYNSYLHFDEDMRHKLILKVPALSAFVASIYRANLYMLSHIQDISIGSIVNTILGMGTFSLFSFIFDSLYYGAIASSVTGWLITGAVYKNISFRQASTGFSRFRYFLVYFSILALHLALIHVLSHHIPINMVPFVAIPIVLYIQLVLVKAWVMG